MSEQQAVPMIFNKVKRININSVSSLLGKAALPIIGMVIFLGLWNVAAKNIDTSLGQFPGPVAVWQTGEYIN